jgi:hypothetical protein
LRLTQVREAMFRAGWCRTLINQRVQRIKRAFKWVVSEELVRVNVLHGLQSVNGTFGWSFDAADQMLSLTYTPTPVPEPGTLSLMEMATLGWVTFWRRWRQSNSPAVTLSA